MVYLVFVGPFVDELNKRMTDLRGITATLEEAIECAKNFLPRDDSHKAQIHKCALGHYPHGLSDRTIHASLWWDEGIRDWKTLIPSQYKTNGHRQRR